MTIGQYHKYKLEENETSELLDLINKGFGIKYIKSNNSFSLTSEKIIKRVADENGLRNVLFKNNARYKSEKLSYCAKEKRDNIIKYYHNMFSSEILTLVNNENYTPNDICKKFNIPRKLVNHLIEFMHIEDMCDKNSKLKLKLTAQKNGKLSAKTLAGIELKPITKKISDRFIKLKNDRLYGADIRKILYKEFGFKYKKYYQLCKKYGFPEPNPQTGKLNSMYGKSPSHKSGIGVKCWILYDGIKVFCRSSLELKVYCYLIDNNIKFELSKHRIKYKFGEVDRTYNPDIVIGETICEIKPSKMIGQKLNLVKHAALKKYCFIYNLSCKILTEQTQDLTKYDSMNYVDNLIKNGNLIIDEKNLKKLKKYIGKIKYERN